MWETHAQPFTPPTPAMDAPHVGRGPSFINEDQVFGVQDELAMKPILPFFQDVGPVLLYRVARSRALSNQWRSPSNLFPRQTAPVEEPPKRRAGGRHAKLDTRNNLLI